MFNLKATADILQLVTSAAGTIDAHTSWIKTSGSTYTQDRTNPTQITTAATTTLVGSPTGTDVINVKYCSIRNAHATIANTVTVQHTDGTNVPTIYKCTLYPGDQLQYTELGGWAYIPSANTIQVPGRLLLTTIKTTGSSFTTSSLTNKMRACLVGGGGGGAGNTSVASAAGAGGGGGAGGYGEVLATVAPSTAYSYAIGGGGASNSGASGGNGGDTTLTIGGTTYTAKGGSGATTVASSAALTAAAGGAGGVVGTNCDINASGQPGEPGVVLAVTPTAVSGAGGSSLYGAGGLGVTAASGGNNATGNGSGGGGSLTGASAARAGGSGTVGLIAFYEFS